MKEGRGWVSYPPPSLLHPWKTDLDLDRRRRCQSHRFSRISDDRAARLVVVNAAVAIQQQAGVQSFRERLPQPAMRPFVACLWVQQVSDRSGPYTHRTIPDGCAELVCGSGEDPRIIGPRTVPSEEIVEPGAIRVGVRFRTGAVPAAFGVPASELVDRIIGLEDRRRYRQSPRGSPPHAYDMAASTFSVG